MLSRNLLQYRMHSYETGEYFSVGKDYINAEKYYRAALRFDDNDVKVWQKLGAALMMQKKCDQAKDILSTTYKKFPQSTDTPLLFIKLYTECEADETKVNEWKKVYDVLLRKSQQQLQ